VALRWPGGARTLLLETGAASFAVAGCPAWLEANADRAGFYRVRYAAPLANALASVAAHELAPAERVGLVSDAWADVRAGVSSPSQFLALVASLGGARAPAVVASMTVHLAALARRAAGHRRATP
jgi:hypothetical protein